MRICTLFLLVSAALFAKKKIVLPEREITRGEENSVQTLFHSLDPLSISQHLAFYSLYPETKEGKEALLCAWELLGGQTAFPDNSLTGFAEFNFQGIIDLITKASFDSSTTTLTQEQMSLIAQLGRNLHNRSLKGSKVTLQKEALSLLSEETDLARTLLLFQLGEDEGSLQKVYAYEAQIDLMAMQIRSRLTPSSTHEEKIKEINRFIFHEMQFRFPPQSLHAADIDLYTFLPSVLDGRQGVCLGVSILYLALAQRLDLPLEIITPPGHIYVRYNNGKKIINIETTARGINTPSEIYLGINTCSLEQRSLKETVGLAFMNEAAVHWSHERYAKSLQCYETAILFLPNDPLLKMFLGFSYLFNHQEAKGRRLLKELPSSPFAYAVSEETIPKDFLSGKTDVEGIKAVFLSVDETRSSILKKQHLLEETLQRYPTFRAGLLQLATTWLQLNRTKEAKEVLDRYHQIDPHNAIVEYYLSILCLERLDYNQSWHHFKLLCSLLNAKQHHPSALFSLKHSLVKSCPE